MDSLKLNLVNTYAVADETRRPQPQPKTVTETPRIPEFTQGLSARERADQERIHERLTRGERTAQQFRTSAAQLDPLAAQINGCQEINGTWVRLSPTVPELAATLTPLPRSVAAGLAVVNTYKAVHDPSATNILGAGLSVAGTGAGLRTRSLERGAQQLEEFADAATTQAAQARQLTSETARQIGRGERVGVSLSKLAEDSDRLAHSARESADRALRAHHTLEKFERTVQSPLESAEGGFKAYELQHKTLHVPHHE